MIINAKNTIVKKNGARTNQKSKKCNTKRYLRRASKINLKKKISQILI